MALYHKYRPKTFSEVIGQKHVTTTIENQLKNDKTNHAYLFSGPRGIGKTTIARILAKSLNCEAIKKPGDKICNKCQTCLEIDKSRSIDVIEMDAATHTQVDNIRENVIENSQFKPTSSKYKIFIIDEVHMLSTGSFNALLKTIEEPPKHVIFILATTELHKIPDTIISRCQRYKFNKVSSEEIKKYLKNICKQEKVEVEDEVLDRIIKKSEGCVRDAISLLDQVLGIGNKKIKVADVELILPSTNIENQINFLEFLLKKQASPALKLIDTMMNEGMNLSVFSKSFIEFLHFFMIASIDFELAKKEIILEKALETKIKELLNLISKSELIKLIDLTIKRDSEIKSSPLPQIPLELLILEWTNTENNNDKKNNINNNITKNKFTQGEHVLDEENTEIIEPIQIEKNESTLNEKTEKIKKEVKIEKSTEIKFTQGEHVLDGKKFKLKNIIKTNKRNINLEELNNNWARCLEKIETYSPSLIFILKLANLLKIENNTLTMEVGFCFHQEKLSEAITKKKIQEILGEVLGEKIKIEVIINEEKKKMKADNELQNLASALGGEVM